jgi:hypothetical protein
MVKPFLWAPTPRYLRIRIYDRLAPAWQDVSGWAPMNQLSMEWTADSVTATGKLKLEIPTNQDSYHFDVWQEIRIDDTLAQDSAPGTIPNATALVGGGTFSAGMYYVGYTYLFNDDRESIVSPLRPVIVAAGGRLSVGALPVTLPKFVKGVRWFISQLAGSNNVFFSVQNTGQAFIATTPGSGAQPPTSGPFPRYFRGFVVSVESETIGAMRHYNMTLADGNYLMDHGSQVYESDTTLPLGYTDQHAVTDVTEHCLLHEFNAGDLSTAGINSYYSKIAVEIKAGSNLKSCIEAIQKGLQTFAPTTTPFCEVRTNTSAGFTVGTYFVGCTWVLPEGETIISPYSLVDITSTGGQEIFLILLRPAVATSVKVYVSDAPLSTNLRLAATLPTLDRVTITAPPPTSQPLPPTVNPIVEIPRFFINWKQDDNAHSEDWTWTPHWIKESTLPPDFVYLSDQPAEDTTPGNYRAHYYGLRRSRDGKQLATSITVVGLDPITNQKIVYTAHDNSMETYIGRVVCATPITDDNLHSLHEVQSRANHELEKWNAIAETLSNIITFIPYATRMPTRVNVKRTTEPGLDDFVTYNIARISLTFANGGIPQFELELGTGFPELGSLGTGWRGGVRYAVDTRGPAQPTWWPTDAQNFPYNYWVEENNTVSLQAAWQQNIEGDLAYYLGEYKIDDRLPWITTGRIQPSAMPSVLIHGLPPSRPPNNHTLSIRVLAFDAHNRTQGPSTIKTVQTTSFTTYPAPANPRRDTVGIPPNGWGWNEHGAYAGIIWDDVPGAHHYHIKYWRTLAGESTATEFDWPHNNGIFIENLLVNINYSFKIASSNRIGDLGSYSLTINWTVPPATVPLATGLSAANDSIDTPTTGHFDFMFTNPGGSAWWFEVRWAPHGTTNYNYAIVNHNDATSVRMEGLRLDDSYDYSVKTWTQWGDNSGWTADFVHTVPATIGSLFLNGDFEIVAANESPVAIYGWDSAGTVNGGSVARDSTQRFTGQWAAKLSKTTTVGSLAKIKSSKVSVSVGRNYNVEYAWYGAYVSGTATVSMTIWFYKSDGTPISSFIQNNTLPTTTAVWTHMSYPVIPPALSAWCTVEFQVAAGGIAYSAWIDTVTMRPRSRADDLDAGIIDDSKVITAGFKDVTKTKYDVEANAFRFYDTAGHYRGQLNYISGNDTLQFSAANPTSPTSMIIGGASRRLTLDESVNRALLTAPLDITGGFSAPMNIVTTNAILDKDFHTIMVDASSGAISITLPTSTQYNIIYYIKRIDNTSNAVKLLRGGTDTIEGSTFYPLRGKDDSVIIQSGGTSPSTWRVLQGSYFFNGSSWLTKQEFFSGPFDFYQGSNIGDVPAASFGSGTELEWRWWTFAQGPAVLPYILVTRYRVGYIVFGTANSLNKWEVKLFSFTSLSLMATATCDSGGWTPLADITSFSGQPTSGDIGLELHVRKVGSPGDLRFTHNVGYRFIVG